MRIINKWASFTNCACALLINGRAFTKESTEISEKSSGNQKPQRDFEISYAKTDRVRPLGSTMERSHSDPQSGASDPKRRTVSYSTFQKWRTELDKDCKSITWLECDTTVTGGRKTVTKLKCGVCVKFKSKIAGRRNYSDKWIVGADCVHTSNIKDHAKTDQHQHAMTLLKKERAVSKGQGPLSYARIAQVLHELPEDAMAKLRVKFDLAHFIATEKIAFSKYPALCELEAHHGVNVGSDYNNEHAAKTFCHYIAETRREDLAENLASAKFFSILMDGSTDKGNIDDEMFLALWCDVDGTDEKGAHENGVLCCS